MDNLKLQYFTDFLLLMGFLPVAEGKFFQEYQPLQNLGFPADYFLELPKDDSKTGFREYAERIVGIRSQIYHCDVEDLQIVLEKGHNIFLWEQRIKIKRLVPQFWQRNSLLTGKIRY